MSTTITSENDVEIRVSQLGFGMVHPEGVSSIWARLTPEQRVALAEALNPASAPYTPGGQWTRDDFARLDIHLLTPAGEVLDAVVAHLNAHHPKPQPYDQGGVGIGGRLTAPESQFKRERDALEDRLVRQAATIATLQSDVHRAERERDAAVARAEQAENARDTAATRAAQLEKKLAKVMSDYQDVEDERDEWKARAEAAEARTAPAVTRDDIEKAIRDGFDYGGTVGEVRQIADAIMPLLSGSDPAVYVVRESDIAAVKVERHEGGGMETPMLLAHMDEAPSVVRDPAANYLKGLAETEALARAIEAGQAVDPVEEKAREWAAIMWPDAHLPEGDAAVEALCRLIRHLDGQEAGDE